MESNHPDLSESSLRTTAWSFMRGEDVYEWFTELVAVMQIKYEDMPERGSNWTLAHINDLEIHIRK